ncbi:MAG: tetratricopeptide repeat protein [Candidatus Obscuribacterales bacterium]
MDSVKTEPKVVESVSNRVGYIVVVLIPVALLICPLLMDMRLFDESASPATPASAGIGGKKVDRDSALEKPELKKDSEDAPQENIPGNFPEDITEDIPAPSPELEGAAEAASHKSASEQFDELIGQGVSSLNVGSYEKAEQCFREAYSISGFLGNDDPRKVKLFELIGRTYLARKSYNQAIQFLRYVRYYQEKRFGKDSREAAYTRSLLARAYQGLGRRTQNGGGD